MASISPGQTAPAFSLGGLDGKAYTLYKDGARLTLAVFFKTTCPACRLAWSYLEMIHRAYRDAGLAVWGISQHDRAQSAEFASTYGSAFPILLDDAWRVSKQYDPEFVPTLCLIDADGKIIDTVVAFDKAGLNRLAQTIGTRLGVAAAVVAPDNDGNPPFKPG